MKINRNNKYKEKIPTLDLSQSYKLNDFAQFCHCIEGIKFFKKKSNIGKINSDAKLFWKVIPGVYAESHNNAQISHS